MSKAWFSPASGAINEMDTLLNTFDGARMQERYKEIDRSVIDEPPAARSLAIATASGAPIQRLSEHLLFAIFDFVRDGHAFLQCDLRRRRRRRTRHRGPGPGPARPVSRATALRHLWCAGRDLGATVPGLRRVRSSSLLQPKLPARGLGRAQTLVSGSRPAHGRHEPLVRSLVDSC